LIKETVRVEKVDDVYVRVVAEPGVKMEMSEYFTFFVPGYKFMPAYKSRVWDGKIRLLNTMTGIIYGGLVAYIAKFCMNRSYDCIIDEALYPEVNVDPEEAYNIAEYFKSTFIPRDYQNDAVVHALKKNRALLLSPTASGKSFIIYLLTRIRMADDLRTLIIVPTTSLVDQMASDFIEYNNGEKLDIHKIRGGADKNVDAKVVISTWQSIYKLDKSWFDKFDMVIGDEAHLFKAKSLTKILEKMPNCKYRYGFTGTLDGTQTHKLVLEGVFGPVYEVTTTKKLMDDNTLANLKIVGLVLKYPLETCDLNKGRSYQDEIDWIVTNDARNKYIRNLAHSIKGNTLILFQFVEKHGKILHKMLDSEEHSVHFVHGGVNTEEREEVRRITEETDNNIILASYGTFSTGINIKKLDNVIFASPSKSKIRNLQSIGRGLRKGNGKTKATLYDIVDDLRYKSHVNFAFRHFAERVKIYNDESFQYKIYDIDIKE